MPLTAPLLRSGRSKRRGLGGCLWCNACERRPQQMSAPSVLRECYWPPEQTRIAPADLELRARLFTPAPVGVAGAGQWRDFAGAPGPACRPRVPRVPVPDAVLPHQLSKLARPSWSGFVGNVRRARRGAAADGHLRLLLESEEDMQLFHHAAQRLTLGDVLDTIARALRLGFRQDCLVSHAPPQPEPAVLRLLMATLGLSPAAMSWRLASRRSSHQPRRSASTPRWAGGSASTRPGRARAPPAAPAPARPCTCNSARRRPGSTRRGAPSAPGRSCPRGRFASSARASGRCATRRTPAPPRRRCRGASSRGAAWRRKGLGLVWTYALAALDLRSPDDRCERASMKSRMMSTSRRCFGDVAALRFCASTMGLVMLRPWLQRSSVALASWSIFCRKNNMGRVGSSQVASERKIGLATGAAQFLAGLKSLPTLGADLLAARAHVAGPVGWSGTQPGNFFRGWLEEATLLTDEGRRCFHLASRALLLSQAGPHAGRALHVPLRAPRQCFGRECHCLSSVRHGRVAMHVRQPDREAVPERPGAAGESGSA